MTIRGNGKIIFQTILFVLFVVSIQCFAANIGGNWSNSLYYYKDRIDTTLPALRYYESFNVYAKRINGSHLSAYSNVNITNGFGESDHKQLEITHAYLEWLRIANRIDVRAGRQRDFEGNAPVYFDGIKVKSRIGENVILSGHGGFQIPSRYRPELIETRLDSNIADVSLKGECLLGKTQGGLTYHRAMNTRATLAHDLGMYASHYFFNHLYSRGNFILDLTDNSLEEFQVLSELQLLDNTILSVSALVDNAPSDSTDIFSRNFFKNYREVSANIHRLFAKDKSCGVGYLTRSFEDEGESHQINLQGRIRSLYLGLRQDFGFGGRNTKVDAGMSLWKVSMIDTRVNGSFMRYSYSDPGSTARYSWVNELIVDFGSPVSWWNAHLKLQALRNQYYKYDNRISVYSDMRFSKFTK